MPYTIDTNAALSVLLGVAIYHVVYLALQAQLIIISGGGLKCIEAFATLPYRSRIWFVLSTPYVAPFTFYAKLLLAKGDKP
jgi:hypothetical protein